MMKILFGTALTPHPRPTHVMVSCNDSGDQGGYTAWPVSLEDFAKLFVWKSETVFKDGRYVDKHTIEALPAGRTDQLCIQTAPSTSSSPSTSSPPLSAAGYGPSTSSDTPNACAACGHLDHEHGTSTDFDRTEHPCRLCKCPDLKLAARSSGEAGRRTADAKILLVNQDPNGPLPDGLYDTKPIRCAHPLGCDDCFSASFVKTLRESHQAALAELILRYEAEITAWKALVAKHEEGGR